MYGGRESRTLQRKPVTLSMFVYPAAPLVEVIRSALFRDTLERPDANAVVKRDSNGSLFAGFGVGVLQNHVVAPRPIVSIAEFPEDGDDLLAGKIA